MDQVLQRILDILTDPAVALLEMSNLVKSLFYGLWNFDKMLNQHRLSTRISELLIKTPKQSAKALLRGLFAYLSEKWNLIDHHRINKFMQLVKYLLKHAVGMCQLHRLSISKLDTILLETVFKDAETKSGLAYHIIDVYYNTLLENS